VTGWLRASSRTALTRVHGQLLPGIDAYVPGRASDEGAPVPDRSSDVRAWLSGSVGVVDERYESELARAAAVLDSVDDALARLNEGAYGSCATCGSPIADLVLEQDPTRSLCEQHLPLAL
jgi:hypothetical protein